MVTGMKSHSLYNFCNAIDLLAYSSNREILARRVVSPSHQSSTIKSKVGKKEKYKKRGERKINSRYESQWKE
jgi:hypothetical protein